MEKYAGYFSGLATLAKSNPVTATTFVLGTVGLSANIIRNIINKIQNDVRRKEIIEDLAAHDPVLSKVDKDQLKEWYATMYYYAPSMTVDKNTVREVLTGFARFGKIDIQTLKMLAETERTLFAREEQGVQSLFTPFKVKW